MPADSSSAEKARARLPLNKRRRDSRFPPGPLIFKYPNESGEGRRFEIWDEQTTIATSITTLNSKMPALAEINVNMLSDTANATTPKAKHTTQQEEEPILAENPNRFVLFPIEQHDVVRPQREDFSIRERSFSFVSPRAVGHV